jgi:hypothetical protein
MNDKTVLNIIEEVCDEMCNNYCKYIGLDDQDELDEHCNECPLNKLQ